MDDMYRKAVDAAAIFSETDLSGRITYVNEQFCDVSGYPREELLGANHRILNSGFHPPEFFVGMWRTISRGQVWKGEICNRGKDGTVYWVDSTMVPLVDESTGQVRKYLSIRFDVSEKRQLLHTLQWRVGHDVLTGLPNRAYLSDLLNQALESSRADGIPLAVCMLDLDGFKAVNDGYGHASGDLLLIEVAKRLKSIMRGEDVVARLAGDEFVLILRHVRDADELHGAMQRVLTAISRPYTVGENSLSVCQHWRHALPARQRRCRHAVAPCRSGHVRGQAKRTQPLLRVRCAQGARDQGHPRTGRACTPGLGSG